MKASFHYAVKVKLIRYETKDDIDFIVYEKVYKNENPILARQEAFTEYEEWIKDLYTGMGEKREYITDKQARIDLQKFTTPLEEYNIQIDKNEFNFNSSLGYGIGVYLIIDKPYFQSYLSEDMYDKQGDEHLLHGIGTSDQYNDPLEISSALNQEILYYQHYNYNKGGFERKANFYDWDLGDTEEISFLETPFDWTGLDVKPEEEPERKEQNRSQRIQEIIANGEGNKVEFKPSLLYNFKTGKAGISVKAKIATAICAFLNANGGLLFIGLDNDGKPLGLDKDFGLA
ncbi:MAG: ATP-binding protein, partial [archaeon]